MAAKPEPLDGKFDPADEDKEDAEGEEKFENDFPPFVLAPWEMDIIYDKQQCAKRVENWVRRNAAFVDFFPTEHCETMAEVLVSVSPLL